MDGIFAASCFASSNVQMTQEKIHCEVRAPLYSASRDMSERVRTLLDLSYRTAVGLSGQVAGLGRSQMLKK
ncbi:hypothetical protein M441DRAFT_385451 [Trichoderma asperellum CBS 433.97]|uniref:Uncharacterized protein n=1 Tax=Trichoderma asperellum (strain ATCC 204424 / CBS 433.97 / NBRC 101777) TaxID=1042311 RepID=A0A2T3ZBI3_TRIA4|nr:hypothetical protein M441DRAFT_385451 [Trichoderma asperellum CBS 433.97]PTB42168.1 hypothetical protein M441DRAFT_385451 [Trichoderma asperellum CBS 433.97]